LEEGFMEEDREEHYWSRFAASYDRDGEYVVGNAILRAIEERLRKERTLGHTIEFGCGTGYFTKAIAGNATQVVATDLSDAMLGVARRELAEFGNVRIQKADCRDSAFAAESFDTAVLVNLVHVIENPSQCLQEAHRIVRHRGSLIVVGFTSHGMSFPKGMKLVFRYVRKWGRPPRHGQHNLSPEELARLVEDSGFQVNEVELLKAGANALYLRGERG
jgi:ubiquinone/menaquinone biosynthesis C-methylase UbiE